MKLYDMVAGGSMGVVLGFVLAQSVDLIPAVTAAVIIGISVAYASRTVSKQPND